jgi:hypothetical protein
VVSIETICLTVKTITYYDMKLWKVQLECKSVRKREKVIHGHKLKCTREAVG